ncbi:MAG TPA: DUF87 domain-containing protein [Candidatus Dormibacteraeota bacterium]|nr:DUF87 domain-containing protein [Candidatus Dormibacteraeota bacterium]
MSNILFLVIAFIIFGLILGGIAFLAYRRALRRAKGIERGLKMVPLLIHLPPPTDHADNPHRDARDVLKEKISQAEVLYDLITGTAQEGFRSNFYGQRHIAFEIIASNGLVHFFAAVPVSMVEVIEQAILTAYPGARLEEVEDHNIFNPQGKLTGTSGGELTLKHEAAYPIATYETLERDPLEALLNALSKIEPGEGAAVQVMLRPSSRHWVKHALDIVAKKRRTKRGTLSITPGTLAKAAWKAPSQAHQEEQVYRPSKLEESILEQIEEKTKHPSYEILIRVLASSPTYDRSHVMLRNIINAFALFEAPGMNGFKFMEAKDIAGLATAFIFRFFPPELNNNIVNSMELATLFHLPDSQYIPTSRLQQQRSKQVDGPVATSPGGLLFGYNIFRGAKKEIRLSADDRRRHTYIVGQTGTGKSTLLENLAVQDMLAGGGFAFIDPHGDTAERLMNMVPKNRAEDVIYFNPADTEYPLGLNLFEFSNPAQKDFLIQESINMLYKMYDPGKTGIIGPRFEHWYRNAALTLMADPAGATIIEIPKVFTDNEFLKRKFKHVTDPTVVDFWTKEMAQTSDYHKSEMLGWFVSKFGAFASNEMMRNILGQTKSAFNLREIMDQKKILIVNLSKGRVGDLNSQLLGMILVIKFQAAAMSRAAADPAQRPDFCLYVDEFQSFSTDSFAQVLSEARKYGLNLVVANQFIGQLTEEIKESVFGNVGTIASYRCGPEDAEFLVKQFAPVFDARDIINLPNFNTVMKMMIGGVPSQPFSVTALPPLGVANAEMGLAIKQLSAAKHGLARPQAESDISVRLQTSRPVPLYQPKEAAPVKETPPSPPAKTEQASPIPPTATTAVKPAPIANQTTPAAPQAVKPVQGNPAAQQASSTKISDVVKTNPRPPAATSAPAAASPPPESAPASADKSYIIPGEIYVDEHGIVHQG